jgi:hypothetical protein
MTETLRKRPKSRNHVAFANFLLPLSSYPAPAKVKQPAFSAQKTALLRLEQGRTPEFVRF